MSAQKFDWYVQVIVDAPVPALDYGVPETLQVMVGDRVLVPLGSRRVVGIVVRVGTQCGCDPKKVRAIISVFSDIEPLRAEWLAFTKFAADYYLRTHGESALSALPTFFRKPPTKHYVKSLERRRNIKKKLIKSGIAPVLNKDQVAAAQAIVASMDHFTPFVLFGVTGSGKTEVYLHSIASVLAKDPQAQVLLLVPEINLTPQLEERVRSRFPDELVVTLHSGLSQGDRASHWLAIHEGRARVLVGTRLAIFASFKKLSLIIVDEEHDASFKAGDGLRFSARDLAIKRAHSLGIPCVLGSATPSLETWAKVQSGQFPCLRLSTRAVARAHLPDVQLIDMRAYPGQAFSPELIEAVNATLERKEQVLFFMNRRGYAPVISCTACGWVSRCMHCSGFTVFHKREHQLVCHHCGTTYAIPEHCPSCGNVELVPVGTGTQKIEEALLIHWPNARILRIDRDSVRTKNAAEEAFSSVHSGAVDIVIGTQMIAKGHDFKRVGLVAILNPDGQLMSPNPRSEEQLFATLVQVAGRAGRDQIDGHVFIQTRFPKAPLFEDVAQLHYERFAARLLQDRKEAHMPPFSYQALLLGQSVSLERTLGFMHRAVEVAYSLYEQHPTVMVYQPVPMPLMRLNNQERAQLLVEAESRAQLHAFLRQWVLLLPNCVQTAAPVDWVIEVDPMDS